MEENVYICMDHVWMPSTMDQVKAIYEKKRATDALLNKRDRECYVTYAKETKDGHLLECHYGECSTSHPDGCTYCAAGFSRCVICGASDYDQTWPKTSKCSGRKDIILLKEDKNEHCCRCDSVVYEALHEVHRFEMGSNNKYLHLCTYCATCHAILSEDCEHYVVDGVTVEDSTPY